MIAHVEAKCIEKVRIFLGGGGGGGGGVAVVCFKVIREACLEMTTYFHHAQSIEAPKR